MNKFANTDQTRLSPLLAVANGGEDSKGLETGGYKPLMRNRKAAFGPPAIGSTASNTFR